MSYQFYANNRASQDSQLPLSNPNNRYDYEATPMSDKYDAGYGSAGYGAGYNNRQANSRYPTGQPPQKKKSRKWLWILLAIVVVLIIAGAVLGGVFGSRASKDNNTKDTTASGNVGGSGGAATRTVGLNEGAVLPTATDAWGDPLYPTSTAGLTIAAPAVGSNSSLSCGSDSYSFPGGLGVRTDHPRLFAPAYKWQCLAQIIPNDNYLTYWNATIFANATKFYNMAPTNYSIDGGLGGSGVLDVAREVQLRIKHWGYAWKMSNDTKWVDRAWTELQTAAGNSTTGQYFGVAGDNWNTQHFLDVAEFTAAFGIAYDWMYDAWTAEQKNAIMWSIINLGLTYGLRVYTDPSGSAANYSWWSGTSQLINGNWNCVCNGGLTIGALAIANEDPTGIAAQLLTHTVPNANAQCVYGPSAAGAWSETPNYWYFGTTGHAQMAAALLTATGSTQNLLETNPGMQLSGLFHMHVVGLQGIWSYGDAGPNKYTATANGIMFYGQQYNNPVYTLYQRDRGDAPEPMSVLYYDPQVTGSWWNGLALDHFFDNTSATSIATMRSSWTDSNGLYVGIKSDLLTGHQTHGDLDAGTFVIDAVGQRWAGELGSGNYLADGYFSSEAQNSERWVYYRTRTEGQNTLLLGGLDQNVNAVPTAKFETTNETQTDLMYTAPSTSTAYYVTDLTNTYNGTSVQRGIRLINGRRQVLLQDEVNVPSSGVQWRMHTNATVTLTNNNQEADLELNGSKMTVKLLSPSSAQFGTAQPVRLASDPALPTDAASQDQPNPGVTVLTIDIPTGQQTVQVLFNPQWPNFSSFVTPPTVALSSWSLTSHN